MRRRNKKTLIAAVVSSILLLGLILFVLPQTITIVLFFLLAGTALFLWLSFLFNHTRRALLIALGCMFILLLRLFELTHWLYPVLIVSLIIAVEAYLRKQ